MNKQEALDREKRKMEYEKIRAGLWSRAENEVAEELGFRIKEINGETFIVFTEHQEPVGKGTLAGEAMLKVWTYAVRTRHTVNRLRETGARW